MFLLSCLLCALPHYPGTADLQLSGRSNFTEGMRVELTDGWYSIDAGLDGQLAQLVLSGRLTVRRGL